jgi:hypothetical protein
MLVVNVTVAMRLQMSCRAPRRFALRMALLLLLCLFDLPFRADARIIHTQHEAPSETVAKVPARQSMTVEVLHLPRNPFFEALRAAAMARHVVSKLTKELDADINAGDNADEKSGTGAAKKAPFPFGDIDAAVRRHLQQEPTPEPHR